MHRHICVYMHWGVCEAAQTQAADKSTDKHACMHMYIGIPSRVRVDIYVQGNEYWHVQACVPIFVPANCAQVHVQTGTCRFPQANGPIAAQPSGCCEGGGGSYPRAPFRLWFSGTHGAAGGTATTADIQDHGAFLPEFQRLFVGLPSAAWCRLEPQRGRRGSWCSAQVDGTWVN